MQLGFDLVGRITDVLVDEQGTAVLVVTHDHRALDVFDAIYEMDDGDIALRA